MKKKTNYEFSSEFRAYVGEDNLMPDNIPCGADRFYIARSNLEALLSYSCRVVDARLLREIIFVREKFLEFFAGIYKGSIDYYFSGIFPISGDPREESFQWSISKNTESFLPLGAGGKEGNGFIELFSAIYGISRIDAFGKLSRKYALTEVDLFEPLPKPTFLVEKDDSCLHRNSLPNNICCHGGVKYYLDSFFDLRTTTGVAGSLVLYLSHEFPEKGLVVPCYVNVFYKEEQPPCEVCCNIFPVWNSSRSQYFKNEQTYLTIGVQNVHLLYGADEISLFQSDVDIILCESALVALKLVKYIKNNCPFVSRRFFITTWWGGSPFLEKVSFNYLEGKNVIFIPALGDNIYSTVEICYYKCINSFVRKFSVVLNPIVGSSLPRCGSLEKMKRYEKFCASRAIKVSEFDDKLFVDIVNGAISFEKFSLELKEKGFWSEEIKENDIVVDLPRSIGSIEIDASSETSFSFDRIFQKNKIGLIMAANDSGKSIFALSIIYAISHGVSMFGIEAIRPRNVLLIDGETDKDILKERYERIDYAYGNGSNNVSSDRLTVEGFPRGDNFDLWEQSWKVKVESWIVSGKIDVVVFDNLNSLFPKIGRASCRERV